MSLRTPRCVCLTGPTACGKSEIALELAERLPLEIVSMDSALVYRGMDIGTAKPAADVRASVPHHLIDILDPAQTYSAGRFRSDALHAIEAIESRGRLPLVVGGTLLYLRALRDGLAPLPGRDAAVRASLDAEAAKHGWPALHRRLESLDPDAAGRIAPNDRQRIQRALEVHALTGEPMTALQRLAGSAASPQMLTIALVPAERAELAGRIERRFDAMVGSGFVAEVERLKSRGDLGPDTPSMRSVGYRQIWRYLDGEYAWPEVRARAVAATRQLAKRQFTWLRSELSVERLEAFSPHLSGRLSGRIEAYMGHDFRPLC
ncbi:tRNA (adenosine(37)-N6)-dimethylallyltransferase MiaA [Candidatus Rariloculus sp.]|uniref:tRNA (adenosine(37)-N6)-dimethylallyltransferase MiaA n=1 Tax=Candidatus Rariloculus sp. TaxID=3101265 RepID=UPI003D10842E